MIREAIRRITTRLSDIVFHGRNKAMIIIGTDRKTSVDSGYGDGGQNDPDSAVIDLSVGFGSDQENPNYIEDKSRIYIAEKTNPDEYFQINEGSEVTEEPAIIQTSDNIYLKSRKKIKILNGNVSIYIDDSGNIEIKAGNKATVQVGDSKIVINNDGTINLDASQDINGMIVTHLDKPTHIDPITGAPIQAHFETPPGIPVQNRKVKIK